MKLIKSYFYENINKIGKLLTRLDKTERQREKNTHQ